MTSFRVAATVLPDGGSPRDLWVADGVVSALPHPDAAVLRSPRAILRAGRRVR